MSQRPFDHQGRFISTKCQLCGCGDLRHQGGGHWTCDGLLDPEHPDMELQACPQYHFDGEAAVVMTPQAALA